MEKNILQEVFSVNRLAAALGNAGTTRKKGWFSMYPYFKTYESFLTNGDISIKIKGDKNHCGIRLPKGVVFMEDSSGNLYLNGIRAWVEVRCTAES